MTSLGRESSHSLTKQLSTIMVIIRFCTLGQIRFLDLETGYLFEAGYHLQQVCSKLFCNKTIK